MKKIENNTNYKKKLKILEDAKKLVREKGWSKDIFNKLINNKEKNSDLVFLFPNGYEDLLNLALIEINKIL